MDAALATRPETITIRAATESDAALIQKLAQKIWPVCFKGALTPEQIDNLLMRIYEPESLHEQMREGQQFWIAYHDGRPAGYVSAYTEGDVVWIKKLYCDTTLHGRGIGTALMDCAITAFAPATEARLLVNRENVQAQDYYARRGFVRIAEVPVKMGDFDFVDYLYSKRI